MQDRSYYSKGGNCPAPPIGVAPHQTFGKTKQLQHSMVIQEKLQNLKTYFVKFRRFRPEPHFIFNSSIIVNFEINKINFSHNLAFDGLIPSTEGKRVPEFVSGGRKNRNQNLIKEH